MHASKLVFLAALLFGLTANVSAVEARFGYDVDFARSGSTHSKTVCREDSLMNTRYCSPTTFGPDNSDATRFVGIPMSKPQGATTQYLTFYFYADNYFPGYNDTTGHFVFAVNGRADYVQPLGRGMVIGDTRGDGDNRGCTTGGAAQVETFWQGRNELWRDSCVNGLRNRVWYLVTLTVTDTAPKTISYSIRELAVGGLRETREVKDTVTQIDPNLHEWWLAHVGSPSRNWSVSLMDIRTGWLNY